MNIINVKSINKQKIKKELGNCPKIIKDYIRALENSKEIDTQIITQAKQKIKELSKQQKPIKQITSYTIDINKYFSDYKFIRNICLSYRHDYGIMSIKQKKILENECKEWLRAIKNNL